MRRRGPAAVGLLVVLAGMAGLAQLDGAQALDVLAVVPMGAKSHHIVLHALLRGLAEKGHRVTALEFFAPSPMPPNYTHVQFDDDFMHQWRASSTWNVWDMTEMSYFTRVGFLWFVGGMVSEELLKQSAVQEIIKSDRRFDVVVVESFFNDAFLGLGHRFNAPIVQVCPYVGSSWMFHAVGTPNPYSYVPDPFLVYTDHMTFGQRLFNTIFGIYQELGRQLYFLPKQDAVMRRWIGDGAEPLPYVNELHHDTALMLVNSHVALSYPRPLTPNAVPVGGMHVPPAKPLPQDLYKFISEASDGVIYFSMGSNLNSSELPQEKVDALLRVFSSLKQRVIWKWETDSLPGKPPNLLVKKWLPQVDILAHPNIRLFITHGGLLSSFEALQFGVPVLGIPIFGDQQLNMERAELSGYGVKINYKDLSTESLQSALNEMLSNNKYKVNAKRLAQVLQDEPQKPLEKAIWWIEYVVRHKGAPHLRSGALDLAWYQYHLLDVLFVILIVVTVISLISLWMLLLLCRKLCSRQSKEEEKKIKKKKKN